MTDEFEPRLGRLEEWGRAGEARFAAQLRTAASKVGRRPRKVRFSGAGSGRGGASACALEMRPRHMPAYRMRRVMVKVRIAKASRGGGGGALRAHLGYVQRDGVERDGSSGELYTRQGREPDARNFLERCDGDRHQFQIIVSPEDGARLGDLKETTRALMAQMEADLGTRLDWLAVDHHNTGHPHTHIVIRGKGMDGKDLVIAPDYICKGLAARAQAIVTERLGPRRDLEIVQARQSELTKDRFTSIDRSIVREATETGIQLAAGRSSSESFDEALLRARLRFLEGLKLAVPTGTDSWSLKSGWDTSLKNLGQKADILKTLVRKNKDRSPDHTLRWFEADEDRHEKLAGSVLASLPGDELKDQRILVVEDFHGTRWIVEIGSQEPGTFPPDGAVVEIGRRTPKLRERDASIEKIADRSGGVYSDPLHLAADPGATPARRQGHVRRLEALRRGAIVERGGDGDWQVPRDFTMRAPEYDKARMGRAELQVLSWLPLTEQVRHVGLTWIDMEGAGMAGERLVRVRQARLAFLQERGWLARGSREVDDALQTRLRAIELRRASDLLVASTGRASAEMEPGGLFEGRFEEVMDLGQGRFSVLGNAKAFALVPWQPEMELHRGRDMTFKRTATGMSWTIGIERGLER